MKDLFIYSFYDLILGFVRDLFVDRDKGKFLFDSSTLFRNLYLYSFKKF